MKTIDNKKILENMIEKYNIPDLFSNDIRPFLKLYYYRKNDYIVKHGDKLDTFLFQVSGKAKVYVPTSNGKSLLLTFYEPFKVFGDLEFIGDIVANTNVQVIEDTYCVGVSLQILKEKFIDDPKFLRFVCSSLGDKLLQSSNNSSINLLFPLENRLSSYIIATSERKKGLEDDLVFKGNLTEVSELLGTSYRHLLRTLQKLCEKKILNKLGASYVVIDEAKLKELASEVYK